MTAVSPLGRFERYLSVWVGLCIVTGVALGNLAPGLTLASDGKVTGTVPLENSEGTYNFVVTGRDDNGSTGLGAFNLEVKRVPIQRGCGCGASDVGSGLAWLLGVLLPVVGLRRRKSQP